VLAKNAPLLKSDMIKSENDCIYHEKITPKIDMRYNKKNKIIFLILKPP